MLQANPRATRVTAKGANEKGTRVRLRIDLTIEGILPTDQKRVCRHLEGLRLQTSTEYRAEQQVIQVSGAKSEQSSLLLTIHIRAKGHRLR